MTPYYDDGQVQLWLGDCRQITAWLAADVLVTDPPYGTHLLSPANGNAGGYGRRYVHSRGRAGATIHGDQDTTVRDSALDLWAARGPVMIFASPRLPEPPGEWADRLIWDKTRLGMNAGPWRYQHEMIYASAGFLRVSDASSSILRCFPDQRDHIHAKPSGLMERLVAACPPGVIADPFAGSGSTVIAARNQGKRVIAVELEEQHCAKIVQRLSQQSLFGGAA